MGTTAIEQLEHEAHQAGLATWQEALAVLLESKLKALGFI
jgi:hypothetical protein